jgi:hypothetical protein
MKNLDKTFIFAATISLALLVVITSCEFSFKLTEEQPTKQEIETNLRTHRWRISGVIGHERQPGCDLEFSDDGYIRVERDNTVINGTWTLFNSSNKLLKLNFEFGDSFKSLNQDWVVVESSESKVVLQEKTEVAEGSDRVILERV